jgi:hypothetical protein
MRLLEGVPHHGSISDSDTGKKWPASDFTALAAQYVHTLQTCEITALLKVT